MSYTKKQGNKKKATNRAADKVNLEAILQASERIEDVIIRTPLKKNNILSERYKANIFLKHENDQEIRSYKIRGAYNLISGLSEEEKQAGVVAASAGNHSQAVAYSCDRIGLKGTIFMPQTTPNQKVQNTERFGNGNIQIILDGDTFDEAFAASRVYLERNGGTYVHPFNDPRIICGQGTIAKEVVEQFSGKIDIVLVPVGGGGLIAGIGSYFMESGLDTEIIGVEPEQAPAMYKSLQEGKLTALDEFSHFVDGAAVRQVGTLTFEIAKKLGYEMILVPEGKTCTSMIELYDQGIVAELAGALSVAALDNIRDIEGKNVVCILSGGNNGFDRLAEIRERSMMHEGVKHYFIVEFPQRPGALREFLDNALGPTDDITRFEYTKKTAAETGPALVGISFRRKEDYDALIPKMQEIGFKYEHLNDNTMFLRYFL